MVVCTLTTLIMLRGEISPLITSETSEIGGTIKLAKSKISYWPGALEILISVRTVRELRLFSRSFQFYSRLIHESASPLQLPTGLSGLPSSAHQSLLFCIAHSAEDTTLFHFQTN